MVTGPNGFSRQQEITYQNKKNQYSYVLHAPVSGLYHLKLKAQSNKVNSSISQTHDVELPPSPLKVSIESKTSRSFELMWERNDANIKNFRLLVFKENDCLKEVHFEEEDAMEQAQGSCGSVSREKFGKKQMNFMYNVTDLFPYIECTLKLYLKSEGVVENPDPATLTVRTNPEVPSKIKSINVTVEGAKNVSVCWSPPEPFPGPTNYTLTLVDLGEGPQRDRKQVIAGFYSICEAIDDLEEFWLYKVRVMASTEVGNGPPTYTTEFRTLEAAPGKVTQLEIRQIQDTYHSLNVTWKAPLLRDRNANITNFTLTYKLSEMQYDNETVFSLPWSPAREARYAQTVSVEPEKNYTYEISAGSVCCQGEVLTRIHYSPAGNPPQPTGCVIGCSDTKPSLSEPESARSFSLTITTDFFSNDTNGKITDYGLVVDAVQSDEPTASSTEANMKADHFIEFNNWYKANEDNFQIPYRATPLGWSFQTVGGSRSKREAAITLTVGEDAHCSTKGVNSFCNGPLLPGMEYRVKAFSCTAGGCTETKYVGGYRTKEEKDYKTITIAVSVSCGLVLIILLAVIVVITVQFKHQKQKDTRRHERPRHEDLNMDPYETMKPTPVNAERKYEGMRFDQLAISAFRLRVSNENLNKGKHKVLKGTLQEADGHQRSVAIRKITGTSPFERCKAEIDIMRNIGAHPHIVCFLGYSIQDDNTVFLINGFEERGDLQSFLRDKRGSGSNKELTEANLLLFAENVAEGMAHLSQLETLHGDLRAVNVLLGGDLTAKISGFQHAKPVGFEPKDVDKFTFPLCRWASVETLEGKAYTQQSEVWSFGVLMWEIMTYGATPYGKMKSKEIRRLLSQNCRLACPKSCQIPLYTVMLECWKDDPAERPSFQDLSRRLADMTTEVQQYMNIGIYESLDFSFEEAGADSRY
ncbi:ephrin type-A receptor 4-B-like isoform X2 [Liolophura sinensis]|uniref:ephrin type-A receptor 4-B-like isoform X2 n=1 Tax=Liolophura sinensis TaxID=3198878 RepID=UPI003158F178